MKRKSSSHDYSKQNNKYLNPSLWLNPNFWFWETAAFTETGKDYFRRSVRRIADETMKTGKENAITTIQTRK